ncbi:phospholipase [Streptomyces sp. NBC_00250]|uniref:alpha/beta hydrolase n=1 Tax=Streptomyces sp. NBC_00250 TaxID=2903641 RepID=UPI002E29DB14|nr:phospholipase [Streptomyces sp. NBC_00250]
MPNQPFPVIRWSADEGERAGTPLVVALHGRGADERSFAGLAPHLPSGTTVASVRAPIPEGGGYAWFANRGVGRPLPDSLAETSDRLFGWLDTVEARHSSVAVLGFSGGMAMAGGLVLAEPGRFSAAVLLSGTLPWDAGLSEETDRLAGLPLFWGRDTADAVIPADLVARTGTWLRERSGADLRERTYPGMGHGVSVQELRDIHDFLATAPPRAPGGRVTS